MISVIPGQTWSMIARVASTDSITFKIDTVVNGLAHCTTQSGRTFSVVVGNLRRGSRGAKLLLNEDGTKHVKPVRVRHRDGERMEGFAHEKIRRGKPMDKRFNHW